MGFEPGTLRLESQSYTTRPPVTCARLGTIAPIETEYSGIGEQLATGSNPASWVGPYTTAAKPVWFPDRPFRLVSCLDAPSRASGHD